MTAPRRVPRQEVADKPYEVWNAYVDLLAMSDYEDLTEAQRKAHLVFWYENEVQNGGHLQYFENHGIDRIPEVITALRSLGAHGQAAILAQAAARFHVRPRKRIETVEEYVKTALASEFNAFDRAFHACSPPLTDVLEIYLDQNMSEFVMIVD